MYHIISRNLPDLERVIMLDYGKGSNTRPLMSRAIYPGSSAAQPNNPGWLLEVFVSQCKLLTSLLKLASESRCDTKYRIGNSGLFSIVICLIISLDMCLGICF